MPYVNNVFNDIIYDVGENVKYYAIGYEIIITPEPP
jgi:hypothetical protein